MYRSRTVAPTQAEYRAMKEAADAARAAGLRWPRPVTLAFFRAEDVEYEPSGVCLRGTNPILVYIQSGLHPVDVRETTLHELSHAADEVDPEHDKWEGEQRARAFASRVMREKGWR